MQPGPSLFLRPWAARFDFDRKPAYLLNTLRCDRHLVLALSLGQAVQAGMQSAPADLAAWRFTVESISSAGATGDVCH